MLVASRIIVYDIINHYKITNATVLVGKLEKCNAGSYLKDLYDKPIHVTSYPTYVTVYHE